ncbi:cohesin domain-containing protein [Geomonas edaphica]|uniref:cohesin domain-containing protein n=1 Tax=Geomonas edaphica TaxID=2570226 RepID=UPI0010A78944|nr:cohesin domain-containing protein [Geomonas edaphica]
MMIQTLSRVLLFLSLTLLPLPALALPILSISSPGGDGVFVLYGAQMTGVAGFDVTVGFDSATLSNPRVTFGSLVAGMTSMANTTHPGNPIRMAGTSINAVNSSSGVMATITFDRTGTSPGSITLLTASLIDTAGKKVAMAAPIITNPPPPSTSDSGSGDGQTGGSSGNSGGSGGTGTGTTGETSGSGVGTTRSGGYLGGTLSIPGQETSGQETTTGQTTSGDDASSAQETQRRVRTKKVQPDDAEPKLERGDNPSPSSDERGGASTVDGKPAHVAEPVKVESVLTRFRDFKGERTPANLTALFVQPPQAQYMQVPAVVLADGKATVTLNVYINVGDATPRFSFGDCSYVSYSRIEKGWEIQARPDRDALSASIAVLYNSQRQEFPLVVAPAVRLTKKGQKKVTEADFQRFLTDRGTESAPHFDLNKDGKRDYVDDYIYTANYLVQKDKVR